jgi:hypothetical protein
MADNQVENQTENSKTKQKIEMTGAPSWFIEDLDKILQWASDDEVPKNDISALAEISSVIISFDEFAKTPLDAMMILYACELAIYNLGVARGRGNSENLPHIPYSEA